MQMFQATESRWGETRLARFMDIRGFGAIADLGAWARHAPEAFWRAVAGEVGLVWEREWEILRGGRPPGWFPDARINLFQNLLAGTAAAAPERLALAGRSLDGQPAARSFAQLAAEVGRMAAALARHDVGPGRRLALALPACLEAEAVALAGMCLGAMVTRDGEVLPPAGEAPALTVASRASAPAWGGVVFLEDLLAAPESAWSGLSRPAGLGGWAGPGPGGQGVSEWMLKAAWDLAAALDVGEGDVVMMVADADWPLWPWLRLGALKLGAGVVECHGLDGPAEGGWPLLSGRGVTHLVFQDLRLEAVFARGPWPLAVPRDAAPRVLGLVGAGARGEAWHWLFQQVGGCRLPVATLLAQPATGGVTLAAFPGLPVKPRAFSGPLPGVGVVPVAEGRDGADLVVETPWPGTAPALEAGTMLGRVRVDADDYWFPLA